MKKVYSFILYFSCLFVSSSFAMEENPKSFITIRTTMSEMSSVIPYLEENHVNLRETAFLFDFDETLGIRVVTCNGQSFKFLPCIDRNRTYAIPFSAAFENSPYNLGFFSLKNALGDEKIEDIYDALDKVGTSNLVCDLLAKDTCFVGVCSGLKISDQKRNVMRYVGLDKENYVHASVSKAHGICGRLSELAQIKERVKVVVLMDNSAEFGIDPFLEDMEIEAENAGFSQLTIIGIEFTKYTDMVTKEAIREELTRLQSMLNNSQDSTLDSGEHSSDFDCYDGS